MSRNRFLLDKNPAKQVNTKTFFSLNPSGITTTYRRLKKTFRVPPMTEMLSQERKPNELKKLAPKEEQKARKNIIYSSTSPSYTRIVNSIDSPVAVSEPIKIPADSNRSPQLHQGDSTESAESYSSFSSDSSTLAATPEAKASLEVPRLRMTTSSNSSTESVESQASDIFTVEENEREHNTSPTKHKKYRRSSMVFSWSAEDINNSDNGIQLDCSSRQFMPTTDGPNV